MTETADTSTLAFQDAGPASAASGEAGIEDLDVLDAVEESQEESQEESGGSGSGRAAGSATANRNLIRRVATKTVEVIEAAPAEIAVVANLLGLSTSLVPADGQRLTGEAAASITTAIMTAPRSAATALGDLASIASAEGADQGIVAMTLGRSRMRGVWSLLGSLGIKGFSSSIPAVDAKAARALVSGVASLSAKEASTLEAARTLLRKP